MHNLSKFLYGKAMTADICKIERIYLICFSIIITLMILGETTFWMPPRIPLRVIWLCEFIIAYKIYFVDFLLYDVKKEYICYLLITVSIFIFSKSTLPMEIMVLVLGARGVSFNRILKVWLVISISILMIAYVSSVLGVIEDVTCQSGKFIRHSFGINYPTSFGAYIFFIMASITYFINKKRMILPIYLFIPLIYYVYYYSYARLAVGCMILMILGYLVLYIGKFKNDSLTAILLKYFSKYSIVIVPLFCFITAILYTPENNLLVYLDNCLTGRVKLANTGLVDYPITLFGQKVEFVSVGSPEFLEGRPYFYIDSSYIKIFMLYGMSGFALFQMLFYKIFMVFSKNQWLIYLLLIIAINGAVDSYIYKVQYCPFLLSVYAVRDNI